MTKSRNINAPRVQWTPERLAQLRSRYANEGAASITAALDVPLHSVYKKAADLGLKKSAEFLAGPGSGRAQPGEQRGAASRFAPGHVPASKGTKGKYGVHPNSRKTQFQRGHKLNGEMPLGTVVMRSNGYLMRKVGDHGYPPWDWYMEHRARGEEAFGPVPLDHVIAFRDGNRLNLDIPNLECISRADLAQRALIHSYPPEVRQVIGLRGAITRRINQYERQQQRAA